MTTLKKASTASNVWPITAQRYVAFIDIMGFKDMVAKMPHIEIYRMMQAINDAKTFNEDAALDAKSRNLVKSTTYSDSMMLYSKDDSLEAFDSLITAVSGLTSDLFIEGIPHKGAVAFGTMTLDTDKSIFFGQPLIDAFLLQDELHFYGIIIHGTVEEAMLTDLSKVPFIEKYDCFLKSGRSSHHTVYPMHVDSGSAADYATDREKIINSLKRMRFKTSGHLRRYIENTETYFQYILEHA